MLSWLRILLILVLVGLPLVVTSGCSKDKDKHEKGVIEKHTDKVAQEAVKMIKTPLNEAKSAAQKQEDYGKEVKKAAKGQ
jgi:hypothetical protein